MGDHLRRNYPDRAFTSVADTFALLEKNLGRTDATTSQQQEATALLQHLFRFGSTRRTDARGRAILHQEANFTVVDDDEILTALPRPASATAPTIESADF